LDLRYRKWRETGEDRIIRSLLTYTLHQGWAGHVARLEEMRNAYTILIGKPEGERPRTRLGRRWEDNINMDLREIG